jgi:hypothetical protein
MTTPWKDGIRIERLMLLVRQGFFPEAELRFAKYKVSSRPRADVLRRRLLVRLQATEVISSQEPGRPNRSKPAARRLNAGSHGPALV